MKHWLLAFALGLAALPIMAQKEDAGVDRPNKGQRMEQMRQDLDLTDAQVTQIKAIHKKYQPERKAFRDAELKDATLEARRKALRQEEQAAVKAALTPEQQQRFEAMHAERHHGHHAPMDPAQRQYFQTQVLPTLQAQRLKLEEGISAADKAIVERLRGELQALRTARMAEQPGGAKERSAPPTEAERAQRAEFHAQRQAIMAQASAVADRYMAQIQQLHTEIQPQLERFRAEMLAMRPPQPVDAPGHAGKGAHKRGGKKWMAPALFLLMDPARLPGQGGQKASKAASMQIEVFPNPAVSRATLRFQLAEAGSAKVELLDAQGRVLKVLRDGQVAAGEQLIDVDTATLPAATYFFRVTDVNGPKLHVFKVVH